jgi:hypothetical protein
VIVARPDIAAGLLERESSTKCALKTASAEPLYILEETFVTLYLWWRPLELWAFITDITDDFILGLNVL